jgi:GNAT superfamily N-acetyltransferase
VSRIEVHPVTADRWDDLVELFGDRGAYGGCWCMYFRLRGSEWSRGTRDKGRANRVALKDLVDENRVPGLLAYIDGRPVGWVSLAPREEYSRVLHSPTTRPVDDRPAWSIVCFYIDRRHRGERVASTLLDAAVRHARSQGARLVEGYPLDFERGSIPNANAYPGLVSMFEPAGFREIERRSARRPIMRRDLRPRRASR